MPKAPDSRLDHDDRSPYFRLPVAPRVSRRRQDSAVGGQSVNSDASTLESSRIESLVCGARVTDGCSPEKERLVRDPTERRPAAPKSTHTHEGGKQYQKTATSTRQPSIDSLSINWNQNPSVQPQVAVPMNIYSMQMPLSGPVPNFNPIITANATRMQLSQVNAAQIAQQQATAAQVQAQLMQQRPTYDPRMLPFDPHFHAHMMKTYLAPLPIPNPAAPAPTQKPKTQQRSDKRTNSHRPHGTSTGASQSLGAKVSAATDPFWHMTPYSSPTQFTPICTNIDPSLSTIHPPTQAPKQAAPLLCTAPSFPADISIPPSALPNLAAKGLITPSVEYLEAHRRRKQRRGRKTHRDRLDTVREGSMASENQWTHTPLHRDFNQQSALLLDHVQPRVYARGPRNNQIWQEVKLSPQLEAHPRVRAQPSSQPSLATTTRLGHGSMRIEGVKVKTEDAFDVPGHNQEVFKSTKNDTINGQAKPGCRAHGAVNRVLKKQRDDLQRWGAVMRTEDYYRNDEKRHMSPKRATKRSVGACCRSGRIARACKSKESDSRGEIAELGTSEDTLVEAAESEEPVGQGYKSNERAGNVASPKNGKDVGKEATKHLGKRGGGEALQNDIDNGITYSVEIRRISV